MILWSNGIDTKDALKRKGFESIVIKNGVDFDNYDQIEAFDYKKIGLQNKIKVVTIGTVQKIKGYYEIIDALRYLKDEYGVEVHLIGLGKGSLDRF